ncbi:ROK family transcriptional regulator [Paenibacillus harenae]|nr:ROK family protein [Paenibacillus harenae]MDQ0060324.1 putative NBD/HSP70 family sugar kinase [Paenibacillus harenae]
MNELFATPEETKKAILRGIRAALLTLGSATKAELSGKLRLSFPTVSKFLAQMEREGELLTVGLDDSSGGRRARRYAYNPEYMLGLAIFLEQAETNYMIFNCVGEVKDRGQTTSFLLDDIENLARRIESIVRSEPRIKSLSIGVPASVRNGRLIYIPGYAQFQDFDLKKHFEDRLSIPVVVENDMNAAVLGYNDNRRVTDDGSSLVYLYLGNNGPGAGIMINGELVRGSSYFSGEVSFVPQYTESNFLQALSQGSGMDADAAREEARVDAISRLVASFAAILNPHAIIFCDDEVDDSMIDSIAARSAFYIPAEHLPKLVASDWRQDYLSGLQHLGLDLMISRIKFD